MDEVPYRILEPEIMCEEEEEAFCNNNIHIGTDNQNQVVECFHEVTGFAGNSVLDIGCSIANLPIYFAWHFPNIIVFGIDASQKAIKIGENLVKHYNLSHRVILKKVHVPHDEIISRHNYFDCVHSRSTLHHFKNGLDFFNCIKNNTHSGSKIFIMDLKRPLNVKKTWDFINNKVKNLSPILKKSYYNSFLSAFRPNEIVDLVNKSGLVGDFKILSDETHILLHGEVK